MPKVHGINLSPFVRKVRVALAEKKIAYEINPVVPFGLSDEFMKMSPLGKIPVYEDDRITIPDSSVIIAYLERIQPKPSLYPSEPTELAQALFLEEYADTRVVEHAAVVFRERLVNPIFLKKETDQAAIDKALNEDLPPVFDYLEGRMTGTDALIGGRFSIADIAVASPFVNFEHGGEKVDAARWPKLAAYLKTVHARPSFRALIEEERQGLPS